MVEVSRFRPAWVAQLRATERDRMSDAQAAEVIIDWPRLREEVLEPLVQGPDPHATPGGINARVGQLAPDDHLPFASTVVLAGTCAAHPGLTGLVDLTVYLAAEARPGPEPLLVNPDDRAWRSFWDRAERHYFTQIRPPETFHLILPAANYASPAARNS